MRNFISFIKGCLAFAFLLGAVFAEERINDEQGDVVCVPKVIHFIHLDAAGVTPEVVENMHDWMLKNPGYKTQLWTLPQSKDLAFSDIEQRSIMDLGFNVVSRAFATADAIIDREEIIKFEVLRKEGGVCVDNVKGEKISLDPMTSQYDLFISADTQEGVSSGDPLVWGARPNHPFIEKVIDRFFMQERKEGDIVKEEFSLALKAVLLEGKKDPSLHCTIIPITSIYSDDDSCEQQGLSSYAFDDRDPHARDIDRLMNTSLARLKVKSQHFMSHFFALIALSLICVVMLAVIVIKIRQRYFS